MEMLKYTIFWNIISWVSEGKEVQLYLLVVFTLVTFLDTADISSHIPLASSASIFITLVHWLNNN